MRIDLLLNKLCLVKTRTIAKKACDKGLVKLNDKIAKSSSNVTENDIIEYQIYGYMNILKILQLPKGNISKTQTVDFYEIITRKRMELSE